MLESEQYDESDNTPLIDGIPHVLVEDFSNIPSGAVLIGGRMYLSIDKIPGLPNNVQFTHGIPYVDVRTFKEFQDLQTPPGWYWCEFYGGIQEYRCFLIPSNLRRAEFFQMEKYNRLLDSSVMPVYQYNGLYVRQDPSHAMPGFYIVSPDRGFTSTDALELAHYIQMRFVDYEVGNSMRDLFNIQKVFRANEERKLSYQNVHTWLLPIDEIEPGTSIHEWNTLEYMIRYSSWRIYREKIINYNKLIRTHFQAIGLDQQSELLNQYLMEFSSNCIRIAAEHSTELVANPKLDSCADVIFYNNGIVVKQDKEAGIPGFYSIESTSAFYVSGGDEGAIKYMRMRFLDYQIRSAMRNVLNIQYAYKLHEDIGQGAHNTAIRILPIADIERYNRIYHFTISDYLREHGSWEKHNDSICCFNHRMKVYLEQINLITQDNLFHKTLRNFYAHKNSEFGEQKISGEMRNTTR